MDLITSIISLIGVIGTLSSIFFAYLAFKRNTLLDQKNEGKSEGIMFSDIGYFKACVDRVEKNLSKVDERDRKVAERLAKFEQALDNVIKRVDEIYRLEEGG